jgi:predicted permease
MSFPSSTPTWRRYLTFWRSDIRADVDEELRFHFAERVEELMARGLDGEAAERTAREEFGDVSEVRAQLHDIGHRMARRTDRAEWLRSLMSDFRYGARSLGRTPLMAGAIVLTLALGVGVNAAMFSLLDVLYLRPPAGVARPEGVNRVWVERTFESGRQFWPSFDYSTYRAIRDALGSSAATAIYSFPHTAATSAAGGASDAVVASASADFFELLGVRPARGRTFTAEDDKLGDPANVAVISDAYWRRAFDGAPDVLGGSVTIGKERYTIVGVMRPGFAGVELDAADVWVPFAATYPARAGAWWQNRNYNGFQVLVRPNATVGIAAIGDQITRVLHRRELLRIPADTLNVARLGSIIRARGPGKTDQEVGIAARLGGVAAIVLLIAIANVVNLLFSRAVRRRQEIAVRLALGIPRARLVRLLVTESVLLSLVAGVAALAAAWWGGGIIRALLLPGIHWAAAPLNWRVLVFAITLAIVAGILAGLVPAMQSANPALTDALKSGVREGAVQRSGLRSALLIVQVALSMVLLVGAALFLESLSNVRGVDIGFDARQLVFARIQFETPDTVSKARLEQALGDISRRLRTTPGVKQVALASAQPMYSFSFTKIFPDADTLTHKILAPAFSVVSPEFFEATGLRTVRGTGFGSGTSRQVVINSAMADGWWPGQSALGRCIRFGNPDAPCFIVAGVVENGHRDNVIEDPKPQFYVPPGAPQFDGFEPQILVVRADPTVHTLLMNEIRAELRRELPTAQAAIERMSDELEPQYRPWKTGAALFTLFGLLAIIVAAVGIYSTVNYVVSQRTHEFGIRIALGAQMTEVLRQVVGDGLRPVIVGVVAGIALALAGGRLIASLLYGVAPSDVRVLAVVSAGVVAVAAAAALVPARRASTVDPIAALRAE